MKGEKIKVFNYQIVVKCQAGLFDLPAKASIANMK